MLKQYRDKDCMQGIGMPAGSEFRKHPMDQEEMKALIKEKRSRLVSQQMLIKEHRIPVFVLVDGWGAAGKGTLIGNLIKDLDPRFFSVITMKEPGEEELRKPFLWRYMETIPEAGKFVFLNSDGSMKPFRM